MRYYLIAGEASGDLHGSGLIRELKTQDPEASFRCWGGDLMQAQGAELVKHYRELAFMGFTEVIANLGTILNNLSLCKKDILQWKPDCVILIDYPGFNLRIAEFLKKNRITCFYYISPQIWAWKESRVKKIKRTVDRMFTILPFEPEFYARHGHKVDFVGHPLLDVITEQSSGNDNREELITLLPGSRKQEIKNMLPVMLHACRSMKGYKVIIAAAPGVAEDFYKPYLDGSTEIAYGKTYELLGRSKAALVTSGTATLEAALFGVPQVVCYKGGKISYLIAKKLIKVKYISLVNLILDKPSVTELIQDEFNEHNLRRELDAILNDKQRRITILNDYKELRKKLGGIGAADRTAKLIIAHLKK